MVSFKFFNTQVYGFCPNILCMVLYGYFSQMALFNWVVIIFEWLLNCVWNLYEVLLLRELIVVALLLNLELILWKSCVIAYCIENEVFMIY